MDLLQSRGVPAGVCQQGEDKVETDPQLRARGYLVDLPHSEMETNRVQNVPFKFSRTPVSVGEPNGRGAPCYGEDNRKVYGGILGLSEDQIADLEARGVI
jgi:crotonobetainyl-CoA:carnitine CoA-transferase CaiB-like acyl-CoA transferase